MFTFANISLPTCFWVRVRSSSDPVGISMSRWIISRLVLINLKPKLLSLLWSGHYPPRLFLASHFADIRCRKVCLLSNIIDLKSINLCHYKSQTLLLSTLHIAALCRKCIISNDLQHIFEHVRVEFIYREVAVPSQTIGGSVRHCGHQFKDQLCHIYKCPSRFHL